ncbi:sigma-70 family RNA polymerase sigma factor [Streptomyces sp. CC224B]|uniref:RNA polymerase sigma factor n=1 Tax=Streptomyces sp. CC224B TaxID=3044571 RepID=UPI0024A7D352|nr:sigma-70 family RNA polymerase sigma factor [Streptomyces sp. CC224B]
MGDAALSRAVEAAQRGDEAAFALVYRWVQPGLLGMVRGLAGDESEDVASEAWLQIARDLGQFTGDGADFRRWAAAVARNRARDHARRHLSRPRLTLVEGEALDLPDERDTADEALEALATDAALALVASLPPDQARAVFLGVLVGLDGPAAARLLGKRPGAVRMALHRGLRRLRGGPAGGSPGPPPYRDPEVAPPDPRLSASRPRPQPPGAPGGPVPTASTSSRSYVSGPFPSMMCRAFEA